jgi:hypothetical protein
MNTESLSKFRQLFAVNAQSGVEYVAGRIFYLFGKLRLTEIIHLVVETHTFMDYFKGFREKSCCPRNFRRRN